MFPIMLIIPIEPFTTAVVWVVPFGLKILPTILSIPVEPLNIVGPVSPLPLFTSDVIVDDPVP
jgi:hypothetical protein